MHPEAKDIILFLVTSTVIIFLLAVLITTLLYSYKRKQIYYYNTISVIQSEFENSMLATKLEIQEETLQNISREIHDNIGLSLTMSKLNLNTLNNLSEFNKKKISNSIDLISKAISDLSKLSRLLNSEFIIDNGLLKAIEFEIEKIRNFTHINIEMKIIGEAVFLDSKKELVIFRIIQESLNNCIKYAKATHVLTTLNYQEESLEIEVIDNGVGFIQHKDSQRNTSTGSGLLNIKSRAKVINGFSTISSTPGSGTTVKISIPY